MPEYTEGATMGSSPIGTPALAVRQDKPQLNSKVTANQQESRLQVDSAGALRVSEEGGKATYYATSQFACDSTATDIFFVPGNATTAVKVLWVDVSTTATAAATGDLTLVRRSAANTAGTAVASSVGQADSADAAASSAPKHYTAHPTSLGTSAGVVYAKRLVQQAAGTPPAASVFFDLRPLTGGKGLRLSGASELLCLNAAAALGGAGNAWDVTVCWVEEPGTTG